MGNKKICHTFPEGQILQTIQGDITKQEVDAIVNAANNQLLHGGGVAAAIARRGGPIVQEESNAWVRKYGPVSHETPAYTSAGNLPCKYIIHAVGPIWGSGNEDQKLKAAIRGSLDCAQQLNLSTIAFPAISTGIFGFPVERAAKIFMETISAYFSEIPNAPINLVRLTLFDESTFSNFKEAFINYFKDK